MLFLLKIIGAPCVLYEIEEEESLLSMLESADAVSCCFDAAVLPTLVLRLASSRKCCGSGK